MDLKVKNVSNSLFDLLEIDLNNFGFKLNRKDKSFSKINGDCKQTILLIFYKETEGIKVKPIAEVRLNRIMDIYFSVAKTKNRNVYTLGNDFFQLIEFITKGNEVGIDEQTYYMIENVTDIDNTAKAILRAFKEYISKYFQLTSSIEKADFLLNKNPKDISVHNWSYPYKAIMGIIAAKLNNNSNYNSLVSVYKKELEDAVENLRLDFDEIVLALEVE